MRSKVISLLVVFTFLCSSTTLSFAQGSTPATGKDLIGTQTLESLSKASSGAVDFSQENGQIFLSGKLTGKQVPGEQSALAYLQGSKALFGIADSASELKKTATTRESNGDTFLKFAQLIGGIKVDGGELVVHYNKNGEIVSVNGELSQDKTILKLGKVQISQSDAVGIAEKQFTYNSLRENPVVEKSIITVAKRNYETYKVNIESVDPIIINSDVYVEAYSGKVLRTKNLIEYDGPTTGSGVDVSGKIRPLNLYKSGTSYLLVDKARAGTTGVYTFTCNYGGDQGPLVRNTTNVFNSKDFRASVSAHYFAGQVVSFYKQLFNRYSLDNEKQEIDSYTHYQPDPSKGYDNAFWDGKEMVYGDGDGVYYTYFSADLDVVGHEMTHGVIQNTAVLDYNNQPGALNESLADTFGVLIETYNKYNVASGGTWKFNTADWVVGDELCLKPYPYDAFRSFSNPARYDQPANMSGYVTLPDDEDGNDDDGGVHTNSGITNKAAYLVAQRIGMAKTANIYYRAMTDYMVKYTDFVNARLCLVQSAKDLYGENSPEAAAVGAAFTAVGIGKPAVTDPYEPNNNYLAAYTIYPGTYHAYCTSMIDDDWYQFNVRNTGDINIMLTDIPAPDDYDIYLFDPDGGEAVASSTNDQVTEVNEAINYTAQKTGIYYLKVEPFAAGAATQMYTLTLTLPGEAVTGVSLDRHTAKLKPGGTSKLNATVSPADAANNFVSWSSNHPSVATVDKAGNIKAVSAGVAMITATTGDGGFTDSCTVSVANWVTGITLSRHEAGLMPGDSLALSAAFAPANATDKKAAWSSSDPAVASVDAATGVITGVAKGSATITATSKDGGFTDRCVITVVTELAAPASVKAKPVSFSSIEISWNETYGANFYEVYRAAVGAGPYANVGETTKLSLTDLNLSTGTKYYYTVRACRDGASVSHGPFSPASFATPLPSTPVVRATQATYNSIHVTWSYVDGAVKYELSRSTAPYGVYKVLTTVAALNYTNTNISTGTTYYYRVRTYHVVGKTKVYGSYSMLVSVATKLATPASVKAVKASSTKIRVSWGKVAGATQYELWRSVGGAYALIKTTASNYYDNSGLLSGQSYYYKVRAYRLVAGKKVYTPFSAVVSTQT